MAWAQTLPRRQPEVARVPQPRPVTTQVPRIPREQRERGGVNRGEQTDPMQQSQSQQADLQLQQPEPEVIITVPSTPAEVAVHPAPADEWRRETRRERDRRRRQDRRDRVEEARAPRRP